jgi:hypothetical protein
VQGRNEWVNDLPNLRDPPHQPAQEQCRNAANQEADDQSKHRPASILDEIAVQEQFYEIFADSGGRWEEQA